MKNNDRVEPWLIGFGVLCLVGLAGATALFWF